MRMIGAMPFLLSVGVGDFSECPCFDIERAELIEQTLKYIDKAVEPEIHPGLFFGRRRYACVLLEFTINNDGFADNINVVRAFPSKSVARTFVAALRRFRFAPSDGSPKDAALIFELSYDKTEVDKTSVGNGAISN